MVDRGQVVARMDIAAPEAQLQAAQAQVRKGEHEKDMDKTLIGRRDSERPPRCKNFSEPARSIRKVGRPTNCSINGAAK
jgi:multidrug efflux pump subunit AcrA (membrane-fusion protein)